MEEHLFSDNYIATAQPDQLAGLFVNSPQFLIYLLIFTYSSQSYAINDLSMEKEVSLEVIFIGYRIRKKILGYKMVYNSEWIMRPNKYLYTIGLHSYQSKIN